MDIIFFAAVAVFIFFKLREQLGKVDKEQKRDSIRSLIKEQTKTINQNPNNISEINPATPETPNPIDLKSQKILDSLDDNLKTNLNLILDQVKLSPSQFLEGAKSAFEIILSAFSIGDLPTLKPLLSEKIFLQFQVEIETRNKNAQFLHIKIISIDEANIINAKMDDNFASITIAFKSKQISYLENIQKEIISGNKTEINSVADSWTFKKDCTSQNPNWLLVLTS